MLAYLPPEGDGLMKGIKGFTDEINLDRIRFKNRLNFPDRSSMGRWTSNVVTVGRSGEMYPTITEAVQAVSNEATEARPFTLMIRYTEPELVSQVRRLYEVI